MILQINTTEEIGKIFLRLIAAIEADASDYNPESLQFTILDEPRAAAARTHYWAKLPHAADGTFDMARVDATIRENLLSLGAETLNGIVYSDIVKATLLGEQATERGIRDSRMMKPGSSQGAIQKLKAMGLIEGEAIERGA